MGLAADRSHVGAERGPLLVGRLAVEYQVSGSDVAEAADCACQLQPRFPVFCGVHLQAEQRHCNLDAVLCAVVYLVKHRPAVDEPTLRREQRRSEKDLAIAGLSRLTMQVVDLIVEQPDGALVSRLQRSAVAYLAGHRLSAIEG